MSLPLVAIGERDLPVLTAHHLRVDRIEPDDLLLQLLDLALQSRDLRLRHGVAVTIRGLQLRQIACDALVDALKTPLQVALFALLPAFAAAMARGYGGF